MLNASSATGTMKVWCWARGSRLRQELLLLSHASGAPQEHQRFDDEGGKVGAGHGAHGNAGGVLDALRVRVRQALPKRRAEPSARSLSKEVLGREAAGFPEHTSTHGMLQQDGRARGAVCALPREGCCCSSC
eukprot:1159194-Pelagomonas_calceolata.AAC.3